MAMRWTSWSSSNTKIWVRFPPFCIRKYCSILSTLEIIFTRCYLNWLASSTTVFAVGIPVQMEILNENVNTAARELKAEQCLSRWSDLCDSLAYSSSWLGLNWAGHQLVFAIFSLTFYCRDIKAFAPHLSKSIKFGFDSPLGRIMERNAAFVSTPRSPPLY